ncbi:hypothetical protein K440DRAFT_618456 [Wilcoxina mikolae CBS 423.85]|nr:hypothetical protein K440DRAFT_618456 [Wilcoxina mikolae CBS 423.85]
MASANMYTNTSNNTNITSEHRRRSRRPQHNQLPPLHTRFATPMPPYQLPPLPQPPPYPTEYYAPHPPPRPTSYLPPPRYQPHPAPRRDGTFTTTYAGRNSNRRSCPGPHAKRTKYVAPKPPAPWVQSNYVPFGQSQRPPTPPQPQPQPQPPPLPPKELPPWTMVDEIAALVQAEIDEIERELARAEFRGGTDKEVVSMTVIDVGEKCETSAKLLAPFSDVYEYFEGEEEDEVEVNEKDGKVAVERDEEQATRRISTGSSRSSGSAFSQVTASTPGTSLDSGSPREEEKDEDGEDFYRRPTAPAFKSAPSISLTTAPIPSTGTSVHSPPAVVLEDRLPTPSATGRPKPEDHNGLSLFGQIRRTLTFKDTVWADIDEELENEEYTDEFEDVVEELNASGDKGLGLGLGLDLGSGMGLKLARSVRVGTIRGGRKGRRKM